MTGRLTRKSERQLVARAALGLGAPRIGRDQGEPAGRRQSSSDCRPFNGVRCGTCGRVLQWRWNPRAGNCYRDKLFECRHCTGLRRICPICGSRVRDRAYALRFFGAFMLVGLGPVLVGLFAPLAITNYQLDSLPVTPLSAVEPGHAYKVFAQIAPNQTDVVYGYWADQTWSWTVRSFNITQNGSTLLVDPYGLVELRPPGSPWGSESGTILYSSGDYVAVYGNADQRGNSTVLQAEYLSGNPSAMGKAGGDIWPLPAGIVVGSAAVAAAGAWYVSRQKARHARAYSLRPPVLADAPPRPSTQTGEVRRFAEPAVAIRMRRNTSMLVAGGPLCAIGVALMATDLLGPVFIGIFVLMVGGFFLLLGGGGRLGRWREVAGLQTDDTGVLLEPLLPASYVDDQYFPWSDLTSFWVTRIGSLGSLLALRSRRGEFLIGSFSTQICNEIAADLRRHGTPELKDWRFEPSFTLPSAPLV